MKKEYRAVSSVGRATRLHREGRGFEPSTAHKIRRKRKAFSTIFWEAVEGEKSGGGIQDERNEVKRVLVAELGSRKIFAENLFVTEPSTAHLKLVLSSQ